MTFSQDSGRPSAIDVGLNGTVYLGGTFGSNLTLGGTPFSTSTNHGGYVAATQSDGTVGWVFPIESTAAVKVTGIAASTSEVFATVQTTVPTDFGEGELAGGAVLLRLSSGGALISSKYLGNAALPGVRVVGAHLFLAGAFAGTIDWGTGSVTSTDWDIVFAKLGLDGSAGIDGWVSALPSTGEEMATTIDVDSLGDVYVGGYAGGTMDFGGGQVQIGGRDAFLLRTDSAGAYRDATWFTGVGGLEETLGLGLEGPSNVVIVGTYDKDLYLGGKTLVAQGKSLFIVKYAWENDRFKVDWAEGLPGATAGYLGRVPLESRKPVVCATAFAPLMLGGDAIPGDANGLPFVVRLESGSHVWHRTIGGSAGGVMTACGQSSAGEAYALGITNAPSLDIGTGNITAGQGKSLLLKLGR